MILLLRYLILLISPVISARIGNVEMDLLNLRVCRRQAATSFKKSMEGSAVIKVLY